MTAEVWALGKHINIFIFLDLSSRVDFVNDIDLDTVNDLARRSPAVRDRVNLLSKLIFGLIGESCQSVRVFKKLNNLDIVFRNIAPSVNQETFHIC